MCRLVALCYFTVCIVVVFCCSCCLMVALIFFLSFCVFFFFKQKTAYEMRISDWSSDVCSSDLKAIGSALAAATSSKLIDRSVPMIVKRPPLASISAAAASIRSAARNRRSEEHTSELQSLMRISYAVFCLKKKQSAQNRTTGSHCNHKMTPHVYTIMS